MYKKVKTLATLSLVFIFLTCSVGQNFASSNSHIPSIPTPSTPSADTSSISAVDTPSIPSLDTQEENVVSETTPKSLEEKLKNHLKAIDELVTSDPVIFIQYYDDNKKDSIKENTANKLNLKKVEKLKTFEDVKSETIRVDTKDNMYKMIEELKKDKNVKYVGPDYIPIESCDAGVTTYDEPYFSNQWGLYNIGQNINGNSGNSNIDISAYSFWPWSSGRSDVTVAVLDGGLDRTHPDLASNCYSGYDFFNNDNTVYDSGDTEHATAIAGIIAAADNNIGIVGVAPHVKILPCKIYIIQNGVMLSRISSILSALDYAHANGARIVNMSFVLYFLARDADGNFYMDCSAIKQKMVTTYSDTLYVVAAGNAINSSTTGSAIDSLMYPQSWGMEPNVIVVAATDNCGNLCNWSNYSSTYCSVAAPGKDIYTTIPGTYGYESGTSFAAPFVAGIAALSKSLLADVGSTITASQLKTDIINKSRPISSLSGKVAAGLASFGESAKYIFINSVTDTSVNIGFSFPYQHAVGNSISLLDLSTMTSVQYTTNSSSCTFNNLIPGHKYRATVCWYTDKNHTWSQQTLNQDVTTGLANGACIYPYGTITDPTSCRVMVTYPTNGDANNSLYYLENGLWWKFSSRNNGLYTLTNLIPGTTYTLRMEWYDTSTQTLKNLDVNVTPGSTYVAADNLYN